MPSFGHKITVFAVAGGITLAGPALETVKAVGEAFRTQREPLVITEHLVFNFENSEVTPTPIRGRKRTGVYVRHLRFQALESKGVEYSGVLRFEEPTIPRPKQDYPIAVVNWTSTATTSDIVTVQKMVTGDEITFYISRDHYGLGPQATDVSGGSIT